MEECMTSKRARNLTVWLIVLVFLHQMIFISLHEKLHAQQMQIQKQQQELQQGQAQIQKQQAIVDKLSSCTERLKEMKQERQVRARETSIRQIQDSHSQQATFRFPSVEERIQYYMGDWYHDIRNRTLPLPPPPPTMDSWCDKAPYFSLANNLSKPFGRAYLFDENNLKEHPMDTYYTNDVMYYLTSKLPPAWKSTSKTPHKHPFRAVMAFGDFRQSPNSNVPVIIKTRGIHETKSILFPLEAHRHFGVLARVPGMDTPWANKTSRLVWRGSNTGRASGLRRKTAERYAHYPPDSEIDIAFYDGQVEDVAHTDTKLIRKSLHKSEMMKNKYLLSMEGNDVATDLKWLLYSSSVVFMAPPTCVSWAMEDQLKPFYHYVPLKPDLSNIPEMIQWAKEHDKECQQISRQATQFMEQLWASDQAQRDNVYILSEMYATYNELYGPALAKCKTN